MVKTTYLSYNMHVYRALRYKHEYTARELGTFYAQRSVSGWRSPQMCTIWLRIKANGCVAYRQHPNVLARAHFV